MKKIFETLKRKWAEYLLEMMVITMGILGAFMLNNWNDERVNSSKEQIILKQLRKEYIDNLKQLLQKVSLRNDMIHSANTILSYKKLAQSSIPEDSLDQHLFFALLRPTFNPSLGVTNELISSGNLYVISNPDLRLLLTTWSSSYHAVIEEEQILLQFTNELFLPFLINHYQIGNIFKHVLDTSDISSKFKLGRSNHITTQTFHRGDAINLLTHPDLEDYLSTIIMLSYHTNDQSIFLKSQIEKVLRLIDQGLQKE